MLIQSDTVPCKYCGTPTETTATQLCNNCWEVAHRVRCMPEEVLTRILYDECPARAAYVP